MNFGTGEIILIIVAILLIFGPSKLPALARSAGKAVSEFKKGIQNVEEEVKSEANKSDETEPK